MVKLEAIEIGFQVYTEEGGEEFGAVREVAPEGRREIVVYVENGGDFIVRLGAIRSVHDGKVVVNPAKLDKQLRDALGHAHDREEPGA